MDEIILTWASHGLVLLSEPSYTSTKKNLELAQ